jgi:hypothetical protein
MPYPEAEPPADAQAVMEAVLATLLPNSSRTLLIGQTDVALAEKYYRWNPSYAMHMQGNVAILQMSASNGTLFGTDPEQWRVFADDARLSGAKMLLVELDLSPDNLSQPKERDMLHRTLIGLRDEGRQVMVVSVQGLSTTAKVKDGIRYVNLGRLWKSDNTINPGFSILRIRAIGNNMQYDLQKPGFYTE